VLFIGCGLADHLDDSSWRLQTTELAKDLRCRIISLKQILSIGNITIKSNYLAQLNTKLGSAYSKSLDMVDLVNM
jgi:hypothetical protein